MPRLSYFYGISIYMYFDDHEPPHIHVRFSGHRGRLEIPSGAILTGDLPHRCVKLVRRWIRANEDALHKNWELARGNKPLEPIPPLR